MSKLAFWKAVEANLDGKSIYGVYKTTINSSEFRNEHFYTQKEADNLATKLNIKDFPSYDLKKYLCTNELLRIVKIINPDINVLDIKMNGNTQFLQILYKNGFKKDMCVQGESLIDFIVTAINSAI